MLALAFGLLLLFAKVNQSRVEQSQQAFRNSALLQGINEAEIQSISLRSNAGSWALSRNQNAKWIFQDKAELTTGLDSSELVDQKAANYLIHVLSNTSIENTLDQANPSETGLAEPSLEIQISTNQSSSNIKLGKVHQLSGRVFASVNNSKQIYLIDARNAAVFNKSEYEIRNKLPLDLSKQKIKSIKLKRAATGEINFKVIGQQVQVQAELASYQTSPEIFNQLIDIISNFEVLNFVDHPNISELHSAGFDHPLLELEIVSEVGKKIATLGKSKTPNRYVLKIEGQEIISQIRATGLARLLEHPLNYISNNYFADLHPNQIRQIELSDSSKKTKSIGQSDKNFKSSLEQVVSLLSTIQVINYVGEAKLEENDEQRGTFKLQVADNKDSYFLQLGSKVKTAVESVDAPHYVKMRSPSQPEVRGIIAAADVQALEKTLANLLTINNQ